MVEATCYIRGCDFKVEDGEHIDGAAQQVQVHFRAVHPTKFFNLWDYSRGLQRYNYTLDEYMEENLGPRWAENLRDSLYYVQEAVAELAEGVQPRFCTTLRAEAQAFLDANANAAPAAGGQQAAPVPPFAGGLVQGFVQWPEMAQGIQPLGVDVEEADVEF